MRPALVVGLVLVLAALVLTTGWAALRPAAVERGELPAPISVPGAGTSPDQQPHGDVVPPPPLPEEDADDDEEERGGDDGAD